TNPATTNPGRYTFYGAFDAWTAVDHRVPLATNFAARYANAWPLSSDLIVWRDPKVSQGAFTCGSFPSWYPLGATSILAFDEDSHVSACSVLPLSNSRAWGRISSTASSDSTAAVGLPGRFSSRA